MLIFNYASKKELKENIGRSLFYTETSFFGEEYKSNGTFVGCNRPSINREIAKGSREFFAEVKLVNGKIVSVK